VQVKPQFVPSQVVVAPFCGSVQAVQLVPQLAGLVLSAQAAPQT
jgi:hypothetical protein